MDKKQLDELKIKHNALAELDDIMENSNKHCAINHSRHKKSTVTFIASGGDTKNIYFEHSHDGFFEVKTNSGCLVLSDKSKTALESISSMMATIVKSVLNDELEVMKREFGSIEIDGEFVSDDVVGD